MTETQQPPRLDELGPNAGLVEEMYRLYRDNPQAVSAGRGGRARVLRRLRAAWRYDDEPAGDGMGDTAGAGNSDARSRACGRTHARTRACARPREGTRPRQRSRAGGARGRAAAAAARR